MLQAPVITILGIDGSGKSTISRELAKSLSAELRVCLVGDKLAAYEHGEAQPIRAPLAERIRHLVARHAKRAKSLKLYKVPKMTDLFLRDRVAEAAAQRHKAGAIVMDGSPLINMLAWAALYKDHVLGPDLCSRAIAVLAGKGRDLPADDPVFTELPELVQIKRLKLDRLKVPDVAVFLDVPAATACRRIAERAEHQQVHETEEKLGKLREAYLAVCEVARDRWNVHLSIVDASGEVEEVLRAAEEAVEGS
jgi:thymidylate kinase